MGGRLPAPETLLKLVREQETLEFNEYIIGRGASRYEMNLVDTSDSASRIPALREALQAL